jgi:hypothetical protein
MAAQHAGGFLRLDAVAAYLGLIVDAALESDLAIGPPRGDTGARPARRTDR